MTAWTPERYANQPIAGWEPSDLGDAFKAHPEAIDLPAFDGLVDLARVLFLAVDLALRSDDPDLQAEGQAFFDDYLSWLAALPIVYDSANSYGLDAVLEKLEAFSAGL